MFNSFQAVVTFAAWPFLINWLRGQEQPIYNTILCGGTAIVYAVGFVLMIMAVRTAVDVIDS